MSIKKPIYSRDRKKIRRILMKNKISFMLLVFMLFNGLNMAYGEGLENSLRIDRIYSGSVPANYDMNEPIVLQGENLYGIRSINFRSSSGKYYRAQWSYTFSSDKVFVHPPRERMKPGTYDIIIRRWNEDDLELKYGVFSVVENGEYIPNEAYDNLNTDRGEVKINREKNMAEINLDRRFRNSRYLDLDLDHIMGAEILNKSVKYPIYSNYNLGQLRLYSRFGDIIIRNPKSVANPTGADIIISLSRLEPLYEDYLKTFLYEYNIKSNFIEVGGENLLFDNMTISIPFENSGDGNLKLIRYDEKNFQVEVIEATMDDINKRLRATTEKTGIYVIVE